MKGMTSFKQTTVCSVFLLYFLCARARVLNCIEVLNNSIVINILRNDNDDGISGPEGSFLIGLFTCQSSHRPAPQTSDHPLKCIVACLEF